MKLEAGLYIVSTPIGNMGDITTRAIETLLKSDYIFVEDTRVTKKLLQKHGIKAKLGLYNDHSDEKTRTHIKYLGLPTDRFMFNGFIPKTIPAKEKLFTEIANIAATMIFFETASRLISTLEVIARVLGDREATVAREITKMYQTIKRNKISGLIEYFTTNSARGEIVLIISGEAAEAPAVDLESEIKELLLAGSSAKTITGILHLKHSSLSKNEIYRLVNELKSK